ncbi:MAG: Nif3-like dinuclear metal center hexameric protein [Prevotella sp.]|nr:Nif3-like dinuclear metal center hexameric protein [Prevotella sp.]
MVDALERFAPLPLQEDYDNAGLQLGLTDTQEVSGALLCLDVTEAVVDEAVALGCNLIVSHHPLIFRPLKHLTDENQVQRTVRKAIINNVALISMHTNLDNALGGVNWKMAEKMGAHVEKREEGSDLDSKASPMPLFAEFPEPMAAEDFIQMLKKRFEVKCVMANELLKRPIRKVAICGGAGSFCLSDAIRGGADAFVTGEMGYHEFFGHEQEIQIAVIGHYQSEQFTCELLKEILERDCPGLKCHITKLNTNPIHYF